MATAELIHARKKNTREFKAWSRWMEAVADLSGRYARHVTNDDPFAYNETASVSVLAAAAACAGYVGLAEFSTAKTREGQHEPAHGRSDFWMKAEGRSWAFEFKQWTGTTPASKRLISFMRKAEVCARQIAKGDADRSVAGLIIPLYHIRKSKRGNKAANRARAGLLMAEFAANCDYVWEVRPEDETPSTYFMFNIVHRWN